MREPDHFRSDGNSSAAGSSTPPDERTKLLQKPPQEGGDDGHHDEEVHTRARMILEEFWILFKGSIPVVLAYSLQMSLQTVSILVVGRLSPEALATAAFSYMFAMATGWLIALGGTTAIDTIASATFTGSKDKHDLGIILQRGFLVMTLFYIPVVMSWAFAEPLFRALGQEDYIAHDSARFLWVLIPGGLGYIYFECMKKYLQAQAIMRPGTYVLLITSPLNAGLNYLFVHTFRIGLLGAPFATGLSYWISFLLLVAYARFVDGSQCWGGWSRKCLQNLWLFCKLAFLGFVHVGTEWWAFEIVALVAGRLGTIPLAAQSVIMTTDQIMNTIPFGIGVATSARVGNLLGSRDAKGASRAANVSAFLAIFLGAIVLAVLMSVKDFYAKIFNDDPAVVKLTAQVMPYVALFQIADGLNGACGGSLRGAGRQHIGAIVNTLSYYVGALPLGIWLSFNGWGLAGLWVGQCIALYLVGVAEWAIVAFSDWDYQAEQALARLDASDRQEAGLEE